MNRSPHIVTLSALTIGAILGFSSALGGAAEKQTSDPVVPKPGPQAATPADAPKEATPVPGALITREWKIPADLIPRPPAPADLPPGITDRETAKNWLISKGIVFQGQAAAVYIVRSSRLIVRNTQDQLDVIDALLDAGRAPGEPVKDKASDPVIPKLELREATPAEVFKTITAATGIKIFYTPAGAEEARLTLLLTNVPTSEAFKYVAGLANLKFSYEKDGVHFSAR